jgi:hypothetical protein
MPKDVTGDDEGALSKTEDVGGTFPKILGIFVLALSRPSGFDTKLEKG